MIERSEATLSFLAIQAGAKAVDKALKLDNA
jgi:hypothetical protein